MRNETVVRVLGMEIKSKESLTLLLKSVASEPCGLNITFSAAVLTGQPPTPSQDYSHTHKVLLRAKTAASGGIVRPSILCKPCCRPERATLAAVEQLGKLASAEREAVLA